MCTRRRCHIILGVIILGSRRFADFQNPKDVGVRNPERDRSVCGWLSEERPKQRRVGKVHLCTVQGWMANQICCVPTLFGRLRSVLNKGLGSLLVKLRERRGSVNSDSKFHVGPHR